MTEHNVSETTRLSQDLKAGENGIFPKNQSCEYVWAVTTHDTGSHFPNPKFDDDRNSPTGAPAKAGKLRESISGPEESCDTGGLSVGNERFPHNTPANSNKLNRADDTSPTMRGPVTFFGQTRSPRDKNEAKEDEIWMRFIFGSDGGNEEVSMEKLALRYDNIKAEFPNIGVESSIEDENGEDSILSETKVVPITAATVQTSENTLLNYVASRGTSAPDSETDFLSQLSPMEGYIEESLSRMSVHNNPARTAHSIDSSPRSPIYDQGLCNRQNLDPPGTSAPFSSPSSPPASFTRSSMRNRPAQSTQAQIASSPHPFSADTGFYSQSVQSAVGNIHTRTPRRISFTRRASCD
jgi:hypothetical protein